MTKAWELVFGDLNRSKQKPRPTGITMVLDKCQGVQAVTDLLPLSGDVSLPADSHAHMKSLFTKHQIGRLHVVGSNDTTAPVIDASYRRFLLAMGNHLANQRYMLGKRPGG